MTLHVPPDEIARLTHPLKTNAARVARLKAQGFTVLVCPDGSPYISMANYLRVTGGTTEQPEQKPTAQLYAIGPKRRRHGTDEKIKPAGPAA